MVLDRRTLLGAAAGSLMVATCSAGAPTGKSNAAGSSTGAPPRDPAMLLKLWTAFKAAFVQPDGRVVDSGNQGISHSEGQGYALVIAATVGDRKAFDAILGWTERTLKQPGGTLYAWRYDPRAAVPVSDPNNASDGDLLIAWGLMLAAARWRDRRYDDRATAIRTALHETMTRRIGDTLYLLPGGVGFERQGILTLNPSYYVWPALDRFRAVDGGGRWDAIIAGGEALIAKARFGPDKLPTDWVDAWADGTIVPASAKPPQFGFDAVRVPLYLALGNRTKMAADIVRFWRKFPPGAIPAWIDVTTGAVAPYALSAGGNAAALRTMGERLPPPSLTGDYYSSVLQALAHL